MAGAGGLRCAVAAERCARSIGGRSGDRAELHAEKCRNTPWPICDAPSGNCVVCLMDDDCAAGKLCVNRECVPGCKPEHGCPDGGGACQAGLCTPCLKDTECGGMTPRCDLDSGLCVPCLPINDNCPDGHFCVYVNGSYLCGPSN